MMRISIVTIAALTASLSAASAAEPTGEWMVEGGFAQVRIENCGDKLWGVVSWQKTPGGKDVNNPDASKRDRPTLGLPILLAMAPAKQNRWDGQIYNTENGKLYTAHISLKSDDVLRLDGCVLGFLCGGQDWTRVKEPVPAGNVRAQAGTTAKPNAPGAKATNGAAKPGAQLASAPAEGERINLTAADICTSVTGATAATDRKPSQNTTRR
jgi:uncharacterized protein (DUF2147 family)